MREPPLRALRLGLGALGIAAAALVLAAQPQGAGTVRLQVEIAPAQAGAAAVSRPGDAPARTGAANVAVWLMPLSGEATAAPPAARAVPRLLQKNKTFSPHVLVVQVGSLVEFPNEDPFFHNVFSLFAGRRFDLGLYEAGSTRAVRFDRAGASFLFCNIHPEMSAVIVAVPTPYYGVSDAAGRVSIPDVPDGRYQLRVWHERSSPAQLKDLEQIVTISAGARELGPVRIPDDASLTLTHKNKYGQEYAPAPANAAY